MGDDIGLGSICDLGSICFDFHETNVMHLRMLSPCRLWSPNDHRLQPVTELEI